MEWKPNEFDEEMRSFSFSIRTANCLLSAQINTLPKLLEQSEGDLLSIRCFGRQCLQEVTRVLSERKLKLKEEKPLSKKTLNSMSTKQLLNLFVKYLESEGNLRLKHKKGQWRIKQTKNIWNEIVRRGTMYEKFKRLAQSVK